nr:uncharacterized protein LOC119168583 [Rhipicephalus microplus]
MDAALRAGLHIINDGSHTFVRPGAERSALDLTLLTDECPYSWRRAPDTEGSVHYLILLEPFYTGAPRTNVYSVVNWLRFRELCDAVPVAGDFLQHNVQCASGATTVCRVPTGTPVPGIKLLNLRAARRRAQRRAERSDKAEDWTVYNRIDAVCGCHAHKQRDRGWSSLCRTFDDPHYQRRAWRVFRALLHPRVPRHPELSIVVTLGISTVQLAELLADTFATIVKAIGELCTADFSIRELRDVLDSRGHRSAPGGDGVTYQMLRNLDATQLQNLLDAYNTIWRTGALPSSWGEALVIPVLKEGEAGVRPFISGFRAHRATAESISDVVSLLEEATHRGEAGYLILFDDKSAFDSLPHNTIFDALCEMGVCGNMLRYVEAFLSGRSFRVRVAGHLSGPRVVSAGGPQASVLSTFLFNVALARFIDHIPRGTAYEVRAAVYADDVAFFSSGPTLRGRQVRKGLQAAIDAVDGFITGIGCQLSAAKTEAMHVHPKRTGRFDVPKLVLRGHRLPWKRRVWYTLVLPSTTG